MGIFGVMNMARQAIFVNQFALNSTSNNIANVNTPGYSRERAVLTPSPTEHTAYGEIGNGVDVETIERLRQRTLDYQFWNENAYLGDAETSEKYLREVEGYFNDLDGTGLSSALDEFWNGWMDLSNNPTDLTRRSQLLEKTRLLTKQFHDKASQLGTISRFAQQELQGTASKINDLARRIADLNRKIVVTAGSKFKNFTVMDKRDKLVDELAKIADIAIEDKADGTVNIDLGSFSLVEGVSHQTVKVQRSQTSISLVSGEGEALTIQNGSAHSLLTLLNHTIPGIRAKLDAMAKNLVEKVNAVHKAHYGLDGGTGRDFFNPDFVTADSIQLNGEISKDPNKIAISKDGNSGDNAGALTISNLKNSQIFNGGSNTFSEYYSSLISEIGQKTSDARNAATEETSVLHSLENQRQSVMGVSLEEEMVNMVKYQHALEASSKVITSADELMQTILNIVR